MGALRQRSPLRVKSFRRHRPERCSGFAVQRNQGLFVDIEYSSLDCFHTRMATGTANNGIRTCDADSGEARDETKVEVVEKQKTQDYSERQEEEQHRDQTIDT